VQLTAGGGSGRAAPAHPARPVPHRARRARGGCRRHGSHRRRHREQL